MPLPGKEDKENTAPEREAVLLFYISIKEENWNVF